MLKKPKTVVVDTRNQQGLGVERGDPKSSQTSGQEGTFTGWSVCDKNQVSQDSGILIPASPEGFSLFLSFPVFEMGLTMTTILKLATGIGEESP